LIAEKYDGSGRREPGRPRTVDELEALVVRMGEENRHWGYRRIQSAFSNLGDELGRSTIAAFSSGTGIEPHQRHARARCSGAAEG
jgi:hypothetical protein